MNASLRRTWRMPIRTIPLLVAACVGNGRVAARLDADGNGLSDVWQRVFGVGALPAGGDLDGDGFTNFAEFLFATDPDDAASRPQPSFAATGDGSLELAWPGARGKTYKVETSAGLGVWTTRERLHGGGKPLVARVEGAPGEPLFTRVAVSDVDTDGDGLTDWEEIVSGFNPARRYTEGLGSTSTSNPVTDYQRLSTALSAATNTLSVTAADPAMDENWPDPARFVIRRTGNLDALTVSFTLGGTATPGSDYVAPQQSAVIPFGADEVAVEIAPLPDAAAEGVETVTLELIAGPSQTLGSSGSATVEILDGTGGAPSRNEAARFLTQATLGPCAAETDRVVALGIEGWIDDQLTRTPNLHLPLVQVWQAERTGGTNSTAVDVEHRIEAWWRQAMRTDAASDPLRQRVAFALSQIFVISDRMSSLNNNQRGMTGYYDTLLTHSFGTYRGLLGAVTRHPWMGLYLSSLKNRKPNASLNRFPDENYAREVQQLFSIGLWLLNPDGTLVLSDGFAAGPDGETIPAGEPIPTYGQSQVSEIARVFTGMSYGTRFVSGTDPAEIPTTRFSDSNNVPWQPMRMFDAEHDLDAKTILLPGTAPLSLPARVASNPDTGAAGDLDLEAFLDHLAGHPNVAPFIGRLLIQRLVTSNPSPAYVARVSAAFHGSGGDLAVTIRAILLDDEARDPARMSDDGHGLVREPYTRFVAMARALDAAPADASAGGRYRGFGSLDGDFLQRPLSAPSVFNFYSPENKPIGPLRDENLSSPEMQIINGVTAITGPNRYSTALSVTNQTLNTATIPTNSGFTRINSSSQSDNAATPENEYLWNTRIDEQRWIDLATTDPAALAPDAMTSALDDMLCYGNMSQPTYRAVTRALGRLDDPFATTDPVLRERRIRARLRNAVHLVTTSADFAVLK